MKKFEEKCTVIVFVTFLSWSCIALLTYTYMYNTFIEQQRSNFATKEETYSFTYTYNYCHDNGQCEQLRGLSMWFNSEQLRKIQFPMTKGFIKMTNDTVRDYVLVTASSDNHFKESMDNIATAQLAFPLRKILYYDLGLSTDNLKQVSTLCQVEIKHFNFSNFPAHIGKNLGFCAWKPLVIHDALTQHTGVLYMDASIRFQLPIVIKNLPQVYQQLVMKSKGFLQFQKTGHSNFAVTHPDTYSYLVTNIELHKNTSQYAAGFLFMYRTREAYQHLLKWYVLCAMNQSCIAPVGSQLYCNFEKDKYREFAGCHRFDQSVVNILQRNWFNFSDSAIFPVRMHTVERGSYEKFKAQNCSKLG